ncbi:pigment epithelium-derived factor-like [Hemiscyllium ocellatum]|uniref:pigment epithelium-derived factor-like n=1 Tax=Hemiscyllium ocellatum TaxID=170820 RepID=UPI002966D2EE|nr:pigment epithelium-derived factor-like [Hemiscyllium ocellatum]XP_060703965.1 pigment epithelium-derived factor-like [Hemiscyllium ocellatum]XP_060703966.1 pigment epithelium-derived factor-like [Hemiscyllium ocellatum]
MKILTALLFLGTVRISSSQEEHFSLEPVEDVSSLLESPDPHQEEEEEEILTSPVQRLAYSISEFGYNLYRQLASSHPNDNIFLSPLTVATGLSSLSLGAISRNKEILHSVLNYNSLNDLDIHKVYKDLLTDITALPKTFKTVSRIYVKNKLRMRSNFLKQVDLHYGARPKAMLGNYQDLQNINNWVKTRTNGLITRAISSIPEDVSLFLLSAAHYKGQLLTKFNPAETVQKQFTVDYGQYINIPMMSCSNYPLHYGYDSELRCKIGMFHYVGDTSLLVFLPTEFTRNLSAIEESLNPIFIHDLVHQLQHVQARVFLPKLKFDIEQELKPTLGEMRLSALYTPSQLNKITNEALMISSIKHHAVLSLEERGVQTAPTINPSDRQLTIDFHVTQPFLLVLYDNPTGSLLHIGKVLDPRGLVGHSGLQ